MITFQVRLQGHAEELWKRAYNRWMEATDRTEDVLSNEAILEWHLWMIEDLQVLIASTHGQGLFQKGRTP